MRREILPRLLLIAAVLCCMLLCGCKGVDFFWFEVRDLDGKPVYTVHPCIDLKGLDAKEAPPSRDVRSSDQGEDADEEGTP